MADFTRFRKSITGFHRADVANYIETLCAQHRQTVKKLQEENEQLHTQLTQMAEDADVRASALEKAEAELAQTQTALSSTETALEEAMAMVEEQEALRAAEAEKIRQAEEAIDYAALELEAYRRAEAMERLSQQRAARVRQQLNDLLDTVSARYEQTGQEIEALSEDIRTNMKRLQEALSDLELIFDETSSRFDTMDAGLPEEPTAE